MIYLKVWPGVSQGCGGEGDCFSQRAIEGVLRDCGYHSTDILKLS